MREKSSDLLVIASYLGDWIDDGTIHQIWNTEENVREVRFGYLEYETSVEH